MTATVARWRNGRARAPRTRAPDRMFSSAPSSILSVDTILLVFVTVGLGAGLDAVASKAWRSVGAGSFVVGLAVGALVKSAQPPAPTVWAFYRVVGLVLFTYTIRQRRDQHFFTDSPTRRRRRHDRGAALVVRPRRHVHDVAEVLGTLACRSRWPVQPGTLRTHRRPRLQRTKQESGCRWCACGSLAPTSLIKMSLVVSVATRPPAFPCRPNSRPRAPPGRS